MGYLNVQVGKEVKGYGDEITERERGDVRNAQKVKHFRSYAKRT